MVAVEFAILGPVEVTAGGQRLGVGGQRLRAVLARLIVAAGHVVAAEALAGELWPDLELGRAVANLQVRVAELRRVFRQAGVADRLVTRAPGYVLAAGADEVDAVVFERLVARGRALLAAGDAVGAAGCLARAEGLWRGPALADVGDWDWARAEAARLGEARLAAVECHLQARLELGEAGGLVGELEALTGGHRLRERLWALRMLALYRCGRQGEALETYQRLRTILVEELGIEPAADLRQLHRQILAQDPALTMATPALAVAALAPTAGPAPRLSSDAETLAVTGDAPAALAALATEGASAGTVPVPRELPADVGAFTGREVELAELDFLLPSGPEPGAAPGPVVISAVAGTAGVGKTALAVRWAHRVAAQFPDGQLYVNLRGYDPGQPLAAGEALARFLRALGVADADIPLETEERAARYRSVTAGKRLLVVLDNAAAEEQVRPLLPGSGSMVVVTSRDSLAGLVARDGAHRLDLDLLPPGAAVTLLTTLIGPRAGADPAAAQALAGLCARLPLALRVAAELAAARPEAPLADLVAELAGEDDRLDLLDVSGDPRAAVASVFSWSYRHLPPDAARMFRLLGLHPAQQWDPCAAAALTATASLAQVRRMLAVLARAHLIQPAGAARYQMHDLLRAYAAGLAATQDTDGARRAALTGLFDYYLAASAAAMDCLQPAGRHHRPGPPPALTPVPGFGDRAAARGWLDAELPALVSIAAHTAGNSWPGHAIGLAATLYRYFWSGHFSEGLAIGMHALAAARQHGDRAAEARMLSILGSVYYFQGDFQRAADHDRQCLALARDIGDRLQEARALANLASVDDQQGRYQQAADGQRQALALLRDLGDRYGETIVLLHLGLVRFRQGRYQQADGHLQEALELARQNDDQVSEAEVLTHLGAVYHRHGRYQQAADHQRHAIALAEEISDRPIVAYALTRLGEVCHRRGEHNQAAEYHQRALTLHQQIGHSENEAEALNGAGATLLATGQPGQAHTCHTTALTLTRRNGNRYQQGRALIGLAEVSRQLGQHDQAADYQQQALTVLRDIGDRGGQTEALNAAGETLLATGQPAQAHDRFTAALTLARRTGDRYQQARAHHGLAGACQTTGDTSSADQHWRRALDIYTGLGLPEATQMRSSPHLSAHPAESPASSP